MNSPRKITPRVSFTRDTVHVTPPKKPTDPKNIKKAATEVELVLYKAIDQLLAFDHTNTQQKKDDATQTVCKALETAQENSNTGMHEYFKNYILYAVQQMETFVHDAQKLCGIFNRVITANGGIGFMLKEIENILIQAQNDKTSPTMPPLKL